MQKISVGGSYGYRRGLRGTDPRPEIAESRQLAALASESPVWMEPYTLSAFNRFAAMNAGQHTTIVLLGLLPGDLEVLNRISCTRIQFTSEDAQPVASNGGCRLNRLPFITTKANLC